MHKTVSKEPSIFDVSKLERREPERFQDQSVAAVLLALGSNHHAEHYLPRVHKGLTMLGEIRHSTAFQNPDFTATLTQPKPDYTNQCVYLSLTDTMTLQQLQQIFKQLEFDCDRQRLLLTANNHKNKELLQAEPVTIRQVTMDIDILLVKFNNKSVGSDDEWIIMADRYPFKAHESAGILELAESGLSKSAVKPRHF